MRNTNSMRFFTDNDSVKKQPDARLNDLGNKIFWEFNPHKSVPCTLPHDYLLKRITQPPIFVHAITDSPDLQQHLANKIITLINTTLEQSQMLGFAPDTRLQQEGVRIKGLVASLTRQIEVDLTRPKGFQIVTGERVKSIIEQALSWKKEVLTWIEEKQQADLEAKKVAPIRKIIARMPESVAPPILTQTTIFTTEPKESWSPSVSAAARDLMLAVAQKEAENRRDSSAIASPNLQ